MALILTYLTVSAICSLDNSPGVSCWPDGGALRALEDSWRSGLRSLTKDFLTGFIHATESVGGECCGGEEGGLSLFLDIL